MTDRKPLSVIADADTEELSLSAADAHAIRQVVVAAARECPARDSLWRMSAWIPMSTPARAQQRRAQGAAGAGGQQTPKEAHATERRSPQGFSVVLVLGDMQAGGSADTVPPAARKALSDMKDFLPYKGYRLLDAQWTLCCGRGSFPVASRLRGADDIDYELILTTSSPRPDGIGVRFLLRQADSHAALTPASTASGGTEMEREIARAEQQLQTALKTAAQRHEVGVAGPPEQDRNIMQLRNRIGELKMRLEESMRQHRVSGRAQGGSSRPVVIDTSFTMEVGETVVVGTSRLKGEKALIAMLTAVAANKPAR